MENNKYIFRAPAVIIMGNKDCFLWGEKPASLTVI